MESVQPILSSSSNISVSKVTDKNNQVTNKLVYHLEIDINENSIDILTESFESLYKAINRVIKDKYKA